MITETMKEATKQTIKKYETAIKEISTKEPEKDPDVYIFTDMGFASASTCLLCKAATKNEEDMFDCTKCIWFNPDLHSWETPYDTGKYPCINDNFDLIYKCNDYESLKQLLKQRIWLLKGRLKVTT